MKNLHHNVPGRRLQVGALSALRAEMRHRAEECVDTLPSQTTTHNEDKKKQEKTKNKRKQTKNIGIKDT